MLDDDNSARYTEAADLVPAMNSALGYITTLFTAAFEQKKLQPFALSELTEVWLYPVVVTGSTGYVNLNSSVVASGSPPVFNDNVWSIAGVDPNPNLVGTAPPLFSESINRFATRVPLESWNYVPKDPFTPGYENVPDDFKLVAYTGPNNLLGDGDPYLMVRPASLFGDGLSRVAVWVLLTHGAIVDGTSALKFPVNIHSLVEQKMLQYITYQNDDERLFKITDKEVKELIQLMN